MVSRSVIYRRRRLRKIIDPRDTDKSRYFAITEFNNCFILRSPSLFCNEAKQSAIIFFTHERSQEGGKRGFVYAWPEYYLQPNTKAKYSWTTLRMSRPLFVGSYLQVTWWTFGQWKEGKFASNDNNLYFSLTQISGGEPREWGCIQQWFWRHYLRSIYWGIICVSSFSSTVFFLYWFGGPFICCSLHCFSVCRVSHDATGETDF